MTVDYARCLPVLPSFIIRETQTFYVEQLGFSSVVYEAHHYLIVRREEMELHFWLTDNRVLSESTSVYIRGGQVPALFEEYSARGVKILDGFSVRPWNMKEFHVSDPHGNLLRFGCAPEEV